MARDQGYITKMTGNYPAKHIIFNAQYFRNDETSLYSRKG